MIGTASSSEEFWIITSAVVIFYSLFSATGFVARLLLFLFVDLLIIMGNCFGGSDKRSANRKFSSTSYDSYTVFEDTGDFVNPRPQRRRKSVQKRRNSKKSSKFKHHQFDVEQYPEIIIAKESYAVETYTNNPNLRQRAVNTAEVTITQENARKTKLKEYLRDQQKDLALRNEETFNSIMSPNQYNNNNNSTNYVPISVLPSTSSETKSNYDDELPSNSAEIYKQTVPNQHLCQTEMYDIKEYEVSNSETPTFPSNDELVSNSSGNEDKLLTPINIEQSPYQVSNDQEASINLSDHEKSMLQRIHEINLEAKDLELQIEQFQETTKSDGYRYIDEMLQRCMSRLDAMEVGKNKKVVFERRSIIKFINGLLYKLDAKAEENANDSKNQKVLSDSISSLIKVTDKEH